MMINDPGLWCDTGAADRRFRPALFLDRDGVIISDTGYLGRPEDVSLLEGAARAIAHCNALRIPVIVVTNQSGISRGYYGWSGFHAVQTTLCETLAAAGARLDGVLACAYHAEGKKPLRQPAHPWRKPNPGMILAAAERMNLDLSRSWIIGDKAEDIASGAAAGLAGGTVVGSDDEARQKASRLETARFVVTAAASLAEAVNALLKNGNLCDDPSQRPELVHRGGT
jgi:D-glycero-D-manno-heptose 1,7-bisphosphate phosphatase